ncbi:hypothetical protein FGO68_gene12089 [Halteria grandinella]|uniref:Uncharacterized protein n=1 Tax=Halteria grandinella TaxID=5974 RepID=A0A8J8NIP5_HALGN|nr:hypothetical protein FGO68_gene12089 [Halteria grandinella]
MLAYCVHINRRLHDTSSIKYPTKVVAHYDAKLSAHEDENATNTDEAATFHYYEPFVLSEDYHTKYILDCYSADFILTPRMAEQRTFHYLYRYRG